MPDLKDHINILWNRLGELGVRPDMTHDEAKRVRFANQIIFLLALPTIPIGIQLTWNGNFIPGIVQLVTATLICIIPWFHVCGWYQGARFILVLGANAAILGMSSVSGWWSGEHLILVVVVLLILAVFDVRHYWSLAIALLLTLGNYGLIESGLFDFTGVHKQLPANRSAYQFNFILVILSTTLGIYYFKQLSSRQVNDIVKRAQQELKAVLDSSFMAILVLDAETTQILDCNTRAWQNFAFSDKKSLLNQPVAHLFSNRSEVRKRLEELEDVPEMEFVRADQSTFWGRVFFVRIFYSGVERIVMRIYDVTEKKAMKAALAQEQQRANKALEAKEYFLSMMSHELRTPIAGIAGIGHMLEEEDCQHLREIGSMLQVSGSRLLNTLSLILDVIDMDTLDGELEITEVQVEKLLEEHVAEFKSLATEKGIAMFFHTGESEHRAFANMPFLTQALKHLLMNAIKFTEQGEVNIYLDVDQYSSRTDLIWIIIRDTGVGMSPDFIKNNLFSPFEQEKKGMDRTFQGMGLGMFFVKRALELMDGKIEVFSEKGEGTEVRLSLPLSRILKLV